MVIGFDVSRAEVKERAGPENYTYNILRALLNTPSNHQYLLYCRGSGISSFIKPSAQAELTKISWPRLWTQAGLALECLRRSPDVLFVPAHTLPLVRYPSLKTVVTIHDVGLQTYLAQYQKKLWRLYGGKAANYAAKNASHVIAVSKSTKKDLIDKLGVPEEKISVVYEGVDHGTYQVTHDRESLGRVQNLYNTGKNYLLFIGTVQPRKNIVRLIEAFDRILKQNKTSDLNLVIVGRRGWLADEIYSTPERLGISERVKFLGYVPTEDAVALLNGATAFVFPSLYEGFGLVVLEAMACGAPVVTSNISSLPEVVGEAGILVDPYSIDEIEKGIQKVLNLSADERQVLVEKGIARASQFTWEKAAKETLKVLEKVGMS